MLFRLLTFLLLVGAVINAQSPTSVPANSAPVSSPASKKADPTNGVNDTHGSSAAEKIGSDVSAPVPLNTPQAKYTREARKKKIEGVCVVSVIVDANGIPQNPRVVQSVGYGLDESAVATIKKYRFKPSMKDGHPVAAEMKIQVNFRIY